MTVRRASRSERADWLAGSRLRDVIDSGARNLSKNYSHSEGYSDLLVVCNVVFLAMWSFVCDLNCMILYVGLTQEVEVNAR